MSLVTLEGWRRYQALGKRRVLNRGFIAGVISGSAVAAFMVLVAVFSRKRPIPVAYLVTVLLASVIIIGVLNLLVSLVAWEVHRRRFSGR